MKKSSIVLSPYDGNIITFRWKLPKEFSIPGLDDFKYIDIDFSYKWLNQWDFEADTKTKIENDTGLKVVGYGKTYNTIGVKDKNGLLLEMKLDSVIMPLRIKHMILSNDHIELFNDAWILLDKIFDEEEM